MYNVLIMIVKLLSLLNISVINKKFMLQLLHPSCTFALPNILTCDVSWVFSIPLVDWREDFALFYAYKKFVIHFWLMDATSNTLNAISEKSMNAKHLYYSYHRLHYLI
jgi:hypothetical protein